MSARLVVRNSNLLCGLAKGAECFADICFSIVEHALEFPNERYVGHETVSEGWSAGSGH